MVQESEARWLQGFTTRCLSNLPYEPSGKPDVYLAITDCELHLSKKDERRWYHGSNVFRPLLDERLFLFIPH